MAETTFNPGDIVYHKANNLRMVVISANDAVIKTEFINAKGDFAQDSFAKTAVSTKPILEEPGVKALYQLESKI